VRQGFFTLNPPGRPIDDKDRLEKNRRPPLASAANGFDSGAEDVLSLFLLANEGAGAA
jgi:hypothetical protein